MISLSLLLLPYPSWLSDHASTPLRVGISQVHAVECIIGCLSQTHAGIFASYDMDGEWQSMSVTGVNTESVWYSASERTCHHPSVSVRLVVETAWSAHSW